MNDRASARGHSVLDTNLLTKEDRIKASLVFYQQEMPHPEVFLFPRRRGRKQAREKSRCSEMPDWTRAYSIFAG